MIAKQILFIFLFTLLIKFSYCQDSSTAFPWWAIFIAIILGVLGIGVIIAAIVVYCAIKKDEKGMKVFRRRINEPTPVAVEPDYRPVGTWRKVTVPMSSMPMQSGPMPMHSGPMPMPMHMSSGPMAPGPSPVIPTPLSFPPEPKRMMVMPR